MSVVAWQTRVLVRQGCERLEVWRGETKPCLCGEEERKRQGRRADSTCCWRRVACRKWPMAGAQALRQRHTDVKGSLSPTLVNLTINFSKFNFIHFIYYNFMSIIICMKAEHSIVYWETKHFILLSCAKWCTMSHWKAFLQLFSLFSCFFLFLEWHPVSMPSISSITLWRIYIPQCFGTLEGRHSPTGGF